MQIEGAVGVVTGAASGIGQTVAKELASRRIGYLAIVDFNEQVCQLEEALNQQYGSGTAKAFVGDVTDDDFRKQVFQEVKESHGPVNICIPAAGITRDELSVKIDKASGEVSIYSIDTFRQVVEVNLISPTYWALEMVAGIAKGRSDKGKKRWTPDEEIQGTVIFIGSVSSQGNKGQISYAVTKAGIEGAAATLMAEAVFYGVRCGVIHPGFTDTPMVRALGDDYISTRILPQTQLGRLIHPEEIADAICFMISNPAVSGELWADAGWRPAV